MTSDETRRTGRLLQGFCLFLAACSLLFVSGCGFHLRGSEQGGAPLPPVAITGELGELRGELRARLRAAGGTVVETFAEAQWVVRLLSEERERRVLSVGSTGKVEEYEIHYAATFTIEDKAGQTRLGPETLSQVRSYGFSESDVLGKDAEQDTLVKDMRREAAWQIVQRLRSLAVAP